LNRTEPNRFNQPTLKKKKNNYKYKHFLTLAAAPLSPSHFTPPHLTLPPHPLPSLSLTLPSHFSAPHVTLSPPILSLLCIFLTLPSAFDFPPLPYGFGSFGF